MEEIKVGEYVRTKTHGIKRIDIIFENRPVNRYGYEIGSEWDGKLYSTIKTTDILKHSFNIIDLIEVGDYVNGEYVTDTWNGNRIETHRSNFHEEDIKSIVTKEQFESMEYKVGD